MTRHTKDDLKDEVEALKQRHNSVCVHSEVVEITNGMTDENGNLIDSKTPDPNHPNGFKLGDRIPTESPVCECHKLIPARE